MNDQFVPTTVEQHVQRMADNAWAAGMLDAVGTFAAYPRKDVEGGYITRIRVRARVLEGRDIMDQLEAVLGGHVRFDNGKVEWQASGVAACLDVLDAVRPYMRRQARRAQLLHELCSYMRSTPRASFEDRGLDAAEVREREMIVTALAHARRPKL